MREIERGNARSQHFHRIDDNVFITEMQFMATLVQIPRAVNAELFKALTVHCFSTPVFQTMFEAVEAAGGLPEPGTSPGSGSMRSPRREARCWHRSSPSWP